ncbi:MAG: anthranilate synthase component I family protein [Sphingobacteriales bacterium]|nr:MAG: anthranilate synthase component I family protein [Sphingobacteriales bacterium]
MNTRKTNQFLIYNKNGFKEKLRAWSVSFETIVYLDSNDYAFDKFSSYECMLAVARNLPLQITTYKNEQRNSFEQLKAMHEQQPSWLFGFFGYDLKNETEELESSLPDRVMMPDLYFFEPEVLITLSSNSDELSISVVSSSPFTPEIVFDQIEQQMTGVLETANQSVVLTPRMNKEDYLESVEKLREHIRQGDLYEVNLCQEWYADQVNINPYSVFSRLLKIALPPFSAFVKYKQQYLLCASPERFLKNRSGLLISQPIKGTSKRNLQDANEDQKLKEQLFQNAKERAENVMIVDLVRNDLTRSAIHGTIKVPELFGTYTFKTVHHLISTITARLHPEVHWTEAIKNAFPMGSMTGAPKIMAMQLIEKYELTTRGLFSGAVGYITPKGDFDFNVVIRSLLYNEAGAYLSLHVGSAITFGSNAESEYEECLLKAQAIIRSLA